MCALWGAHSALTASWNYGKQWLCFSAYISPPIAVAKDVRSYRVCVCVWSLCTKSGIQVRVYIHHACTHHPCSPLEWLKVGSYCVCLCTKPGKQVPVYMSGGHTFWVFGSFTIRFPTERLPSKMDWPSRLADFFYFAKSNTYDYTCVWMLGGQCFCANYCVYFIYLYNLAGIGDSKFVYDAVLYLHLTALLWRLQWLATMNANLDGYLC